MESNHQKYDFQLSMDKLNLLLAKARALTAVAASSDLDDYEPILLNDYMNAVHDILLEAQATVAIMKTPALNEDFQNEESGIF